MAVPKKKTSRPRRNRRRANHDRIAAPVLSDCRQCGSPVPPHCACSECGTYRGRQVIRVEEEAEE
ncbi:MAG: 50S ribosomal protein L32 [Polyangia bacterium]